MNWQENKNIFSLFLILSFLILPSYKVSAAELPYNNPNRSYNTNPYSLSPTNELFSQTMSTILTCTGAGDFLFQQIKGITNDLLSKSKKGTDDFSKTISQTSNLISTPGGSNMNTEEIEKLLKEGNGKSDTANQILEKEQKQAACLNSIAYTLAKQNLSSMQSSMMNWVQTGFKGDPFYIRDVNSYTGSLSKDILKKTTDLFGITKNQRLYPYGGDVSRSLINSYKAQNNFPDSMITTLPNYLSRGATAEQFASDFSLGGWDGWLALTQYPQNNPLGSSMLISQYTADQQAKAAAIATDEINRNEGFINQRRCVEYAPITELNDCRGGYESARTQDLIDCGITQSDDVLLCQTDVNAQYDQLIKNNCVDQVIGNPQGQTCLRYETVTPGILIKEKLTKYINSPETQLELADGINETLNSVFRNMLFKLQEKGGLTGLSTMSSNPENFSDGFGENKIYDSQGNIIRNVLGKNTGSGFSGVFDITKDLGDLYGPPSYLGTWDAKENIPKLTSGNGPKNSYYIVSVPPAIRITTRLDDLTNWKDGDKIFFDDEKKTWTKTVPALVMVKRGVISTQDAYIKEVNRKTIKTKGGLTIAGGSLEALPRITPALGELDYCIPGPNPNWESHANDAKSKYFDYLGGFQVQTFVRGQTGVGEEVCQGLKISATIAGALVTGGATLGLTPAAIGSLTAVSTAGGIANCSNWGSDGMLVKEKITRPTNTEYEQLFKNSFASFLKLMQSESFFLIERKYTDSANNDGYDSTKDRSFYPGPGYAAPKGISANAVKDLAEGLSQKFPYLSQVLPYQVNKWAYITNNLYREYKEDIKRVYGPMTDPSAGSKYLPMAASGLKLTKDIESYDISSKELIEDYNKDISRTKGNRYQLCLIKKEVDVIVATAEKRRNEARQKRGEMIVSPLCKLPDGATKYTDPC